MYATLIAKIRETLEKVNNVKLVFSAPKTKLDTFPAVYFQPDGFINNFETNNENAKTYRFSMTVIVGTSGTNVETVFGTVLPNTVDAIIAQFDSDWDGGTISGHRVRVLIDSAEPWEVSEDADGVVASATLNVQIRLLSSN